MASTINTPEQLKQMGDTLAEVMAIFKHAATSFEADLWLRIMDITPQQRFENFLKAYILSPQAKYGAPKPNDAAAALGMVLDPEAAYATIEKAVRDFGPYQEPPLADPVLVQTIQVLGGWAQVNEAMPSRDNSFDLRAFKDRFVAAFNTAMNQVRIDLVKVEPLRAIGNAKPPVLSLESSSHRAVLVHREKS